MRKLPVLFLAAVLPAFTAAADPVDLDRPGALDQLRQARPDHYVAVMQQVRHVASQSCKVEVPLYHAGANLDLDRLPCHAMVVKTSFPAQTELKVPLEDRVYRITVFLDSNYRIQPAVETR
jgi:hypothetical protein